MDYGKEIIEKLVNDTTFDEQEKGYIEKAVLLIDYYDHLLNMALGFEKNIVELKFNVDERKYN